MSDPTPAPPAGRSIHTFDSGVRVFDDHLTAAQRQRYAQKNIPEPAAEQWFATLLGEITAPRPLFVHVGAAIGYYVLLARRIRPEIEVIAFEPRPHPREAMRENIVLNGLFKTGIVIREEAITAVEARATLQADGKLCQITAPAAPPSALRRMWRSLTGGTSSSDRIEVRTMTIDAITGRSGRDIDLLMVDVAGSEGQVLDGAADSLAGHKVHRWILETHDPALHRQCADRLSAAGYVLRYDSRAPPDQPDGLIVATLP